MIDFKRPSFENAVKTLSICSSWNNSTSARIDSKESPFKVPEVTDYLMPPLSILERKSSK